MKNSLIGESIISLALIFLLSFFLNPFQVTMPHAMHTLMIPILFVLCILLIAVLWKELPGDEREQLHIFIASRFAYFTAVVVLLAGIIIEQAHGSVDPWLIITMCIILLAKIVGHIYGYLRK